jgi:hypothetical protein
MPYTLGDGAWAADNSVLMSMVVVDAPTNDAAWGISFTCVKKHRDFGQLKKSEISDNKHPEISDM